MKTWGWALIAGISFTAVSEGAAKEAVSPIILAQNLGDLLGSEEFCGLSFDQAAIAKFVEDNVEADNMGFASSVQFYANAKRESVKQLSGSQHTLECTQVRRVAREFGFIE